MVDARRPTTLTESYYDNTQPVTFEEDKEACTIAIETFADAMADQCDGAFRKGWNGWNRPDLCSVEHLTSKMKVAFSEGDTVKVGVYLMMLNAHGVTNFEADAMRTRLDVIGKEIERLLSAEEVVLKLSDSPHIDQVIADIHSEMNDLDKERLRLLKKLA